MLIEAPCRLGEKFTHHRSYSNPKEQYLLGIDPVSYTHLTLPTTSRG